MAESWMGQSPHDDFIRNALKTELDELKASDELVRRTLGKVRLELEGAQEKAPGDKPSKVVLFNKIALRYGGALAACLLIAVLVVTLGFNPMTKNKAMAPSKAEDMSDSAEPVPSPEAAASRYELDQSAGMAKGGERADAESMQAAAPEAPPQPDGSSAPEAPAEPGASAPEGGMMMAGVRNAGPERLESLNMGGITGGASKDELSQAAMEALVKEYNLQNGSTYTLNSSEAFKATTLVAGGLSPEEIGKAKSYHDLAGPDSYWVVPLKDQEGNPAMMLPVFHGELAMEQKENAGLNLSFSSDGSTWNASAYMALPANTGLVDWFQTSGKAVNADSGHKMDNAVVLDINMGMDYVVFYTADSKEYGIPFFSFLSIAGVENGRIYNADNLLLLLAQGLVPVSP